MGQKVNPTSLRLIVKKNWQSRWFAQKDFALLFAEDILLKKLANQKLGKNAGIERIEISRDAQEITLTITTSKPGIIIGRSGQGIEDLKKFLEKKLASFREENKNIFPSLAKLEDPKLLNRKLKIEILEVRIPELSAKLMAQNIAIQIEKRIAFRRAANQAMNKIMEKGALGVKINLSGRLGGAEIARREKFSHGSIPLGTIKAEVDYAQVDALTTYGTIGVKVWIYKNSANKNDKNTSK